MYLEISNVATAIGKNPYETREKLLLISWARHAPLNVLEYLLDNNCLAPLEENEEYSNLQQEIYKKNLPQTFDVKDFSNIEERIVKEFKTIKNERNEICTQKEIKQLKEFTQDALKKDNGNNQETNIINKEKYTKGNHKMFYYDISPNAKIGGRYDASNGSNISNGTNTGKNSDDIILEIKTRTRIQNVRRNEYDLIQLICYLMATGKKKGKIVQVFNQVKFDSDEANEKEFGIINIEEEEYRILGEEIVKKLKLYFEELEEIIKTSKYNYLDNVIPKKIRPIGKFEKFEKYDDNTYLLENLCEESPKFNNLLRFF